MFVEQAIRAEWSDQHSISPLSLRWLVEHADPGDASPIITAVTLLRGLLPAEAIAAYAAGMSIANDNGEPAWSDELRSQVTGEDVEQQPDVEPEPEPEPQPEPEQQPTDVV